MINCSKDVGGRQLGLETGRLAKQAAGSVLAQYGDTMVLATITVSNKQSHLPFFPLTVEFREKAYAAGKIPGGFIKREARPSDQEILSCRVIDRAIRPLFPKGFQNEVQVFVTVLSTDQENDASILGLNAASAALAISPLPWAGPVACVRVGRIDGEFVLNPTYQQLNESDLELVVAGNAESIQMVEGGALELSEDEIADALVYAQKNLADLIDLQNEMIGQVSVDEMSWTANKASDELAARVQELAAGPVAAVINTEGKAARGEALSQVAADVTAQLEEEFEEEIGFVGELVGGVEAKAVREQILSENRRIDGRDPDTVRPISGEISVIPRTHGSALFTRGQTQALATVTLGTIRDEQRIDSITNPELDTKSFMLHYNFPPYSVGEVKPIRGVSRREIGHGMLAERGLQAVLPDYDDFPYTLRVVSEILESNGSSSMATVCSGSMALMDAGVPIKTPCAGVAMGLIKDGDRVAILTDILGAEDHLGDMDFKVVGTSEGITSIQMDIKIAGLDLDLLREALGKANTARLHILGEMAKVITSHKDDLSEYAPRIISINVNPERIGEIIGPKGKTIRGIQEETGAEINIEDTGVVTISSVDGDSGERAREIISGMLEEPEVGKIYEGVVKSTTTFGAFVEIFPGTEGLLHISELQHARTENTEEVVKKGDQVRVKLLAIDDRGKMKLSRKALIDKPA